MYHTPNIPYFTTSRYRVQTMVELSNIQPGEHVADLGAGDGRISIAFAQAGGLVSGYEIDPDIIALAKKNIQASGVEKRIRLVPKDFWQEDLSFYDIIAIYPMPDIMEALESKLHKEVTPGTRLLTNYYPFPHWKPTTTKDHIYLYTR